MAEIEKLCKKQDEIIRQLRTSIVNFRKTSKARLNKVYVQVRLTLVEELWTSFSEGHMRLVDSNIEEEDYFSKDVHAQALELYISYKCELLETLEKLSPAALPINVTQAPPSQPHAQTEIKLPRINIPTFSGKYDEWISFHDLFVTLIHNNEKLGKVQKLHYLKSSIKGEAESLIKHIAVTDANYDNAWATLKKRYSNNRYIVNSILKRFMTIKPLATESSTAVKAILDTTNECINSLKSMEISVSNWDPILVYILTTKLDAESVRLWEQHVSGLEDIGDSLPTYQHLSGFLEARFRTLEVLEAAKPSKHNSKNAYHTNLNVTCKYCQQNHHIFQCKGFTSLNYTERKNFIEKNGLCYNCLIPNHTVSSCKHKMSCRRCGRRHHTLIHPDNTTPDKPTAEGADGLHFQETTPTVAKTPANNNVTAHYAEENSNNQVLLATALVKVMTQNGSTYYLRALIDQGSQGSFITESAAQLLGTKKIPINCQINGLGENGRSLNSKHMVIFQAHSRVNTNFSIPVKAYVLKSLTGMLPTREVHTRDWSKYLHQIELADPTYDKPGKVDLLLGADVYSEIITEGLRKGPRGFPTAQKTHLGWILSGQINSTNTEVAQGYTITLSMHLHFEDNKLLQRFWEIESDGACKKTLTEEEERCEKHFKDTHKREADGRYVVALPFQTEDPACQYGSSKEVATSRLLQLERRLLKDENLRQDYTSVVHEYIEKQHMEEVINQEDKDKSTAVYLPHHAVVRQDKTTSKVRVVFDASCKYKNNRSLNDDLMVGPRLQPTLNHIILRWRQHKVCLVSDIIQMYRQVKVTTPDFQRILWRDKPEEDIRIYKINRVTFGTASAPYLATKVLQQLAEDESEKYPLAARITLSDFYMDDLLSGGDSYEEVLFIYKQLTNLLESGGFQLQKWNSNNPELLRAMHTKEEETFDKQLNLDMTVKTLGIAWNNKRDQFQYSINLTQERNKITKRTIASDVSKLFDPMGWLAPTIVLGKVFLQRLWLSGIAWDEEAPQTIKEDWLKYRAELPCLSDITIDRWLHTTSKSKLELHGFADASTIAYAAVVYSRVIDLAGNIHVQILTAKTKVAPVKTVSIPRLELCGAVLLTRLLMDTAEQLQVQIENIYAYTDSQVVLAWLQGHPSSWKTFIANRTSEIISNLPAQHWNHVRSGENPADIASRGVFGSMLSKEVLWWRGPNWLQNGEYKTEKTPDLPQDVDMEQRVVHFVDTSEKTKNILTNLFDKYSTLEKLLRIVAWCKRFGYKEKRNLPAYLTAEEINNALNACILVCQGEEFSQDLSRLKERKPLKTTSPLRSLNPFLDEKGILRVGGRLRHANIPEDTKHQILLPYNNPFSKLIIAQAHRKTLHGGPTLMMNYIRQKYWIIGCKRMINQEVHRCIICVRHRAATQTQLMADLPKQRVTPARPFLNSGVDFAGPIDLRFSKGRGCKTYKGYICIFICMATKAIHLEIVSGLDSEGFVAAFKRFTARRGHCSHIWSDNGTNFIAGNKQLREMFMGQLKTVEQQIYDQLANDGTTWHNIPASAPHFGGLWEAGVRSIKYHLKRIVGNSTLTYEEMSTATSQIEACLNSRPISPVSDNVDDLLPLTPGHFLIGEPPIVVPEQSYLDTNINRLNRWQLVQRSVQHFWDRWSKEYLGRLQQRPKWVKHVDSKIQRGMLVLIKEDNLPPGKWSLARIVDVHPGDDGHIRVVSLKCKNSIIKRPITKICLLPVDV